MDDLKGTDKGELQQKDTAGLTSQGTKGTSQDTIPETLTREQYQKFISDERAKAGREIKAAKAEAETYKTAQTKLESELNETKNKMSEIQRRIDEAEEEEAKGSPESERLFRQKKSLQSLDAKLKDDQRQLEKERQEHASEVQMAKEAKAEMSIITAAVEHHVDIERLKEKCQRFNLTTEEQISDMAETLAGTAEGKKLPPKGDSGKTIGGTELGSLSPKELLEEIQKKQRV